MGKLRALACAALVVSLTVFSPTLHAAPEGFSINRYEPSERGSNWFVLDSLDLRGHVRPNGGLVLDYQYRPLAIYEKDESVRAAIVGHVLTAHLGGGIVMWDRVRFSGNLPLVLYTEGESGTFGNVTYAAPTSSTTIGDLRLTADARLFGKFDGPVTGAFGVRFWAPTGKPSSYTSDGGVRVAPRFSVAGTVSMIAYAASLGIGFRAPSAAEFAGTPIGHELLYSVAAGYRTSDGRVTVGPELFGSTGFEQGFKTRTSPLEGILGAHLALAKGLRVGAGIGAGLLPGYGAPQLRVLGNVEWVQDIPAVEQKKVTEDARQDTDGDGIPDDEDACSDYYGIKTGDPKTNGCDDRDKDGIMDPLDNCPTLPGPPSNEPGRNGCPPPPPPPPGDKDGDFVPDPMDACPDVPGIQTEDPKTNGCPDPDADRDGIPADKDACPDAAGPANPDPKRNGCPPAFVQKDQIRFFEPIRFKSDTSSEIDTSNTATLEAVLGVIRAHPEITFIKVEGHTDNRGRSDVNKKLSQARAASVVKWLAGKGIDQGKMQSFGWGDERPIDGNDTEQGRANNRRIEFHIEKKEEAPAQ